MFLLVRVALACTVLGICPENRAEAQQSEQPSARRVATRGRSHLEPVSLPKIEPARFEGEAATINLPDEFDDVVVGGGGRFLIFRLAGLQNLAVFDVTLARIVKYLPLPSGDVCFTAGADSLVVVDCKNRVVARYNLRSFEKELARPVSVRHRIVNVNMGCASNGPVFVGAGGGVDNNCLFLDLRTLEPADISASPQRWSRSGAGGTLVRVSANGQVFSMWEPGTSPSGLQAVAISGGTSQVHYKHESVGTITPNADGRLLYTDRTVFSTDLEEVNRCNKAVPAVQAGLYVQCGGGLTVHVEGGMMPFASIQGVPSVEPSHRSERARASAERFQRTHFIPDAKVFVVLPRTNNQVVMRRFDLDTALENAHFDYLLIASRPPRSTARGNPFEYQVETKAKRNDVTYALVSGPEGMTMSDDGIVRWQVPADFADDQVEVVVSVNDGARNKRFQSFLLAITNSHSSADLASNAKAGEHDAEAADWVVEERDTPAVVRRPTDSSPGENVKKLELPASFDEIVVGGPERFVIVLLRELQHVAIVDPWKVAVVKYLPTGGENVTIAAGARELVVVDREERTMRRWRLDTFDPKPVESIPVEAQISHALMGSDSEGPLGVVFNKGGRPVCGFVDLATMRLIKIHAAELTDSYRSTDPGDSLFASSDGQTFVFGRSLLSVAGSSVRLERRMENSAVPNADGSLLYGYAGIFSRGEEKIGREAPSGFAVPAVERGFYLTLPVSSPNTSIVPETPQGIHLHVDGELQPLLRIPDLDVAPSVSRWESQTPPVPLRQRFWLIPSKERLVQVPVTRDHLLIRRLSVDDLLRESGIDYLFVTSRRDHIVRLGDTWEFALEVKSKQGALKYALSSAPEDMSIDVDGRIRWHVPLDFTEESVQAVVSIKDAANQEVFHPLSLKVEGAVEMARQKAEQEAARLAAEKAAVEKAAKQKEYEMLLATFDDRAPAAKLAAERNAAQQFGQFETIRLSRKPVYPVRTWTDSQGKRIEAQLIEVFAGTATLRTKSGIFMSVLLSQLSAEDQRHVAEVAAADQPGREKLEPQRTLRHLSMAIGAYVSQRRQCPPARTVSSSGDPLLSWRVELLPYIGGSDLYQLFRHDEPWDSDHNKKLIPFMPCFYQSPGPQTDVGKTNFLVVTGEETLFPSGQQVRITDVRDGTANTAAIVEVPDTLAIEWTRPDDWQYAGQDSVRHLFGKREGGFYAVFLDGQVRLVSDRNSLATVSSIFTRAGREMLELKLDP